MKERGQTVFEAIPPLFGEPGWAQLGEDRKRYWAKLERVARNAALEQAARIADGEGNPHTYKGATGIFIRALIEEA